MRTARFILLLLATLVAGGAVTATLDWRSERRESLASTTHSTERLVRMLSLYPLLDAQEAARNLLSKVLVEQVGTTLAYLIVADPEGNPIHTLGTPQLRASAGGVSASVLLSGTRRFPAADGSGEIVESSKPLLSAGQPGTLTLGVRLPPVPLLSRSRVTAIAVALFLMLAAVIVGYYTIILAIRRRARSAGLAAAAAPAAAPDRTSKIDNVIAVVEQLSTSLTSAREQVTQTLDRNAELSSQLGLASYETQQAYRVLDGIESGIMILDAGTRLRWANRTMLALLGAEKPAVENKMYTEIPQILGHPELLEMLDANRELNAESPPVETQFPDTAPDRHFNLFALPLRDSAGDMIGLVVTAQDVTRLKLARKAQEDFIADVAHEMLTPLTSLRSYAEILATDGARDEKMQKEFYNTINSEVDRLVALVKNVLNMAMMDSGSLAAERVLVRTDWLLDQCLPAIEATAQEKHIAIEKRLPDIYPMIMGDKNLLKVVLVNILGNAVKYTPRDGRIRVALSQEGRNVLFDVQDSGYGIPPDELPHVFEKFYRGKSSSVRAQTGSGLGLATAMQIVKLHNGTIEAQSEPGKGTRFAVRIPAEEFSLEKQ